MAFQMSVTIAAEFFFINLISKLYTFIVYNISMSHEVVCAHL